MLNLHPMWRSVRDALAFAIAATVMSPQLQIQQARGKRIRTVDKSSPRAVLAPTTGQPRSQTMRLL